jgi:fructose-1,6-bisphosphatase I
MRRGRGTVALDSILTSKTTPSPNFPAALPKLTSRITLSSRRSDSDPLTLTRFTLARQRRYPDATGDLTLILSAIQTACKSISSAVRRAGLQGLYGLHGGDAQNASGDTQKKLDVISNQIFRNVLLNTGRVSVMVSEEDEEAILIAPEPPAAAASASSSSPAAPGAGSSPSPFGKYVVVFDPLDGSSNIDSSLPTGTLFGIYRRRTEVVASAPTPDEALRPGKDLVCSGYALYSSATLIGLAFADDVAATAGVNIFTLDPSIGEFILTHPHVRIPAKPAKVYSCNEAGSNTFPAYVRAFLGEVRTQGYSARYVGAMVADVHRTLLQGGVFFYPPTASSPKGKLRLLYECAPMAALLEAAGGRAVSGIPGAAGGGRILDIVPTEIHERSPIILGCAKDVDRLVALMEEVKG